MQGRPVILIGDGEAADAKRRLLERAGAVAVGEDAQAALAIVAVEDDGEAEAAVARLKARGILVNAVDRAALCDFTLPAIVDRDPVLIAIGTGGASAGLAKALRQRFEALLPQSLGVLVEALSAARVVLRTKYPDSTARREAIDAALAESGPLDPFGDSGDVAGWLQGRSPRPVEGRSARTALRQAQGYGISSIETLVLTSSDPDDLTLRQARLLASAATIYHGANVPPAILNRARADAVRVMGDAPDGERPGLTLIIKSLSFRA